MTTRPLILIVDDETRIRRLVAAHLEKAGFDVCQAQDGAEGLEVFRRSPIEPDLVILDLMMPEMNGHETLRELRTFSDVPVLILTARDLLGDKKLGFTAGADDYLVKPFAFDELELRIRALLRRAAAAADTPGARVIVNGPLTLRSAEHDLLWKGTAVTLTEQEYRLLTALASHPGAVLRYAELIRCGWPGEEGGRRLAPARGDRAHPQKTRVRRHQPDDSFVLYERRLPHGGPHGLRRRVRQPRRVRRRRFSRAADAKTPAAVRRNRLRG